MKRYIALVCILLLTVCLSSGFAVSAQEKIDNSALVPKYLTD